MNAPLRLQATSATGRFSAPQTIGVGKAHAMTNLLTERAVDSNIRHDWPAVDLIEASTRGQVKA